MWGELNWCILLLPFHWKWSTEANQRKIESAYSILCITHKMNMFWNVYWLSLCRFKNKDDKSFNFKWVHDTSIKFNRTVICHMIGRQNWERFESRLSSWSTVHPELPSGIYLRFNLNWTEQINSADACI